MQHCQYEQCGCEITDDTAVSHEGKLYCSEDCAQGRGCTHSDCGCRNRAHKDLRDEEPGATRGSATNPAMQGNPTKPAPAHNPGHHTSHNPAQGDPAIRGNPDAGKRDTQRTTKR